MPLFRAVRIAWRVLLESSSAEIFLYGYWPASEADGFVQETSPFLDLDSACPTAESVQLSRLCSIRHPSCFLPERG